MQPYLETLRDGSRVCIEGLQAKPELNGRMGVVRGAFNQESGRWAVHIDANDTAPAIQISIRQANLKILNGSHVSASPASLSSAENEVTVQFQQLSPSSSSSSVAETCQFSAAPASSSASNGSMSPLDAVVQDGSRVCIEGLQAKPELNGRMGVVRGAFNQESGRWAVHIEANSAHGACQVALRPVNLKLIPCRNFNTEWVDEEGHVWPKNVDFARQCAKGHSLVPLGDSCGDGGGAKLMCRLCHAFCVRDSDDALSWLMCSVDKGCCGGYSVCSRCARAPSAADIECAGSDDLSSQGVAVSYLSWLRSTLGASLGRMTTSQFCQLYVRPFSWCSRSSVTQRLLMLDSTAQHVGEATWFISHVWNDAFSDTLEAILLFFEGHPDAASAKVWFDVMVTSQHLSAGPSKPPSYWMSTFKENVARIGGLLLVVDAWDDPSALRRAWCVLELHMIASVKESGGGRFAVSMTAQEKERFLSGILVDFSKYYDMLGRVNAEASDCSRPSDRESIHEGIRRSVGFAKLGRMVLGVMEGWMEEQLRIQAAASAAAGEESAIQWDTTLATVLGLQGRHGEAAEIYEAALKVYPQVLPRNHPTIGAIMGNLAVTYGSLERHQEALVLQEKTLAFYESTDNHSKISSSMMNLAVCYSSLERHSDALQLREKTLAFQRRVLPENHPDIGTAMFNLASSYSHVGRYHDALALQEETLEFLRRVLPKNHPQIGKLMGNIAASYSELGRHREALAMQEKSLEFQRRVLPENHPDIGQSYFSLAVSHRRDGNLQRSLEGARQALRIFQATMTPSSDCVEKARALVIDLTGKIASSYDELGRHREAVALQENCVEEMRLLFPENHPRYAESAAALHGAMGNLARYYGSIGRHKDALVLEEKVLAFYRRAITSDDPALGTAMGNLANTYRALGRLQEALVLQEKTLEFRRRVLPQNHHLIGETMGLLASVYSDLGRHQEALAMKEKTLEFRRRVLPENDPEIGYAMGNLANAYTELGRFQEALELEEKTLELFRRVLPRNHSQLGLAYYNLSISRCKTGDLRRAAEEAQEGLRIFQASMPSWHPQLKAARDHLLQVEALKVARDAASQSFGSNFKR